MDNQWEQLIAQVSRPTPSAALDRRIEQLLAQSRPAPAPRSNRRRWLAGLAAAAAVAVACWLLWQPGASWAQVQTAVQSKPWVHLTAKHVPGESQASLEIWLSYPRGVMATRSADGPDAQTIRYTDLHQGARTDYDPKSSELVRFPVDQDESDRIQSMMDLLISIFRGEQPKTELLFDEPIVARKQRSVEEGGRRWREYELTLGSNEEGQNSNNLSVTIRVDPQTNLPATMNIVQLASSWQWGTVFDYPTEGPADIFALGVPGDTPLDDRMPQGELKRVLDTLAVGNKELDNYFAAISSDGREGRVELVAWRRGSQWRVARCVPPPEASELPKDESRLAAWWQKRCKEMPPVPDMVCDGERVYRCKNEGQPDGTKIETWGEAERLGSGAEAGHWAAQRDFDGIRPILIELAAYPTPGAGPRQKLRLDPTGAGGPAGSVLLDLLFEVAYGTDRGEQHNLRWLDPQHGYAVVKLEPFKGYSVGFDDFRRSPRGIWYPTRTVRTRLINRQQAEQAIREREMFERMGKHPAGRGPKIEQDATNPAVWHEEIETRYFLDFSAELPDELFKPQ